MINIAILGFGVVGSGVADLLSKNKKQIADLVGEELNIKYILDLREFPDSPFGHLVIHDFDTIVNDESIDTVIEVMGGSHPAYEFTKSALSREKNVVSSNKEVVANFGDEFLRLAKENSVSYRFEASVGGGIPIIDPLVSTLRHNDTQEVRGILNGTTNYILTKMFTLGESFENALKAAQERGYAERNPDADILGIDAARKIVILAAIVTGKLIPVDSIHTEGITGIRDSDIKLAESIGRKIKLVARCIVNDGAPTVMVAPFMLSEASPLMHADGVYNAVEYIGSPLGNIMMYGKGAGAGATASAVVSDVVSCCAKVGSLSLGFTKVKEGGNFLDFASQTYLAFAPEHADEVMLAFDDAVRVRAEECAVITSLMTEADIEKKLCALGEKGIVPLSRIRLL